MVLENLLPDTIENYEEAVGIFTDHDIVSESVKDVQDQFQIRWILNRLEQEPSGYDFVAASQCENGLRYKQFSMLWGNRNHDTVCVVRAAVTEMIDDERKVKAELDNGKICIVAGFQGLNKMGDLTTLGRGGSDTTAVAIAATLGADLCQIYTDVDGVYTTDPRIVPGARKLEAITYDEMLELASLGAQVLHNRSVEMAKKYNVDLEVISSFTRNPGTKVKEGSHMEKMNVSGVARDNNCARVAIINVSDTPGTAFKVFSLMAKHNVNIDIILQSVGRDNKKSISFTIRQDDADRVGKILRDNAEMLGYEDVSISTKVAKVSIVGAGMASSAGVASKMFEALAMAGINIRMISTSEIKISVLINEEDSEKAVKAIHEEFFGE